MGLSLFNRRICNTYPGVLKTCDNAALTPTEKAMTDGVGNVAPLSIGTAGVCYTGSQDFSNATVTGLNIDSAGVVQGTGTCSFKVANSLVATNATASGNCSIALGNGASATCPSSISIGTAITTATSGVSIGILANTSGSSGVALGGGANALSLAAVAVGNNSRVCTNANRAVALGFNAVNNHLESVVLGANIASVCPNMVNACAYLSCVCSTASDGGYIIRDAGGTYRRLNITSGGELRVDSNIIAAGEPGVVQGTGTCAIKVADHLINSTGFASGACSIALGYSATATDCNTVVIGTASSATCHQGVSIGTQNVVECGTADYCTPFPFEYTGGVAIGQHNTACCGAITIGKRNTGNGVTAFGMGVAIGTYVDADTGIGIGRDINSCGSHFAIGLDIDACCASMAAGVLIGNGVKLCNPLACTIQSTVGIGTNSQVCATLGISIGGISAVSAEALAGIAIGYSAKSLQNSSITIGTSAISCGQCSIAIGREAIANDNSSVALGYNVCATDRDAVTACEYVSCVAGKGIVMKTPNGSSRYRIAIDNSGNLTTTLVV